MMFARGVLLAAALSACLSCAASYKVLVVITMPAWSHHNLGKGIADILHERGHEITMVSCFSSEKPAYREIGIPEVMELKAKNSHSFDMGKDSKLTLLKKMSTILPAILEMTLKSGSVQTLLNDKTEKFDLVIVEDFINEALIGLGLKYKCPVILLSTMPLMHWLARTTGNPVSPATIPNVFLSFTGEMSFTQRVANTGMAIAMELMGIFVFSPTQKAIYNTYFPEEAAEMAFEEMKKRIALVFINSHPSIEVARPLLPNAIEIGGYHISKAKPLPQEYKEILDNAKNGVIFFSMGSNLKSSTLPIALRKDILKSLSKLKQTILWKFEADLPDKPANVIIKSWMPQLAILDHPNVKLFITHGGLLSTTEAAAAGVPLLAIPIFGDQHLNAKTIQARGNGLMLDFSNLTETSLTWALNEMLNNPKYDQVAKKTYRLFHDRPMNPRDLVSYYAEHVVRTGGAPHLSAPDLGLFSSMLMDVTVVVLLPPLVTLLAVLYLCQKCCSKGSKEKAKKSKKEKKNEMKLKVDGLKDACENTEKHDFFTSLRYKDLKLFILKIVIFYNIRRRLLKHDM